MTAPQRRELSFGAAAGFRMETAGAKGRRVPVGREDVQPVAWTMVVQGYEVRRGMGQV